MAPEATEPPDADVHAAPDLAVPLRAGPLRLVFDRGELRWIRLGEREVLRGIYVAVREEGWATVPAELEDLEIEAEPESFRIRFRARHRRGGVRFDWEGRIEGGADGSIAFRMAGAAGSTFRRNRIGFCVLHPAEECAGRECIVETTDGDRLEQAFPALVSPHQPFRNVRAILHEVTPGVEVEVRMEGETFETEDQRNWSDASFKTYGTPLHLPYPVEVAEGTRVEQAVSVSLFGVTAEPVRQAAATVPGALPKKRNSTEPVVVRVGAGQGVALPGDRPRRRRSRRAVRGPGRAPPPAPARPRPGRPSARVRRLGGGPGAGRRQRAARSTSRSSSPSSCRTTRAGPCATSPRARPRSGPAWTPGWSSAPPTRPRPRGTPRSPGRRSPRSPRTPASGEARTVTSPSSTGAGSRPAASTGSCSPSTPRSTPSTTRRSWRAWAASVRWRTR